MLRCSCRCYQIHNCQRYDSGHTLLCYLSQTTEFYSTGRTCMFNKGSLTEGEHSLRLTSLHELITSLDQALFAKQVTLRRMFIVLSLLPQLVFPGSTNPLQYDAMRLHHLPDASTYPSIKLTYFVYMIYFFRKNKLH